MPGIGVPAAAVLLAETPGRTSTTAHPTSRTRPVTRHQRIGNLHTGEHTGRARLHAGSKRLKRALLDPALTSLRPDPVGRAHHQRKPDQENIRTRPEVLGASQTVVERALFLGDEGGI